VIFDLQERAIRDISESVSGQQALEEAPSIIDPAQQAVATSLKALLSRPDVTRDRVLAALRFLRQPLRRAAVRALRDAHRRHSGPGGASDLLAAAEALRDQIGAGENGQQTPSRQGPVSRENLQLVCFELVTG
jgi:hypothetical protein